jgi:predicted flap endonuclease-1-like 5' DNA nuclease
MSHYVFELALWTLLAFFIGCVIGWLARTMFAAEDVAAPQAGTVAEPEPEPVQPVEPSIPRIVELDTAVAPPPAAADAAEDAAAALRMDRPKGLDEPRDGKPDDLKRIGGIGPKNEKILHTLGFFHFDQIAEWTVEQVAWVDDHLKFNGRIGREDWIAQARLLADGREKEFLERFGTGAAKKDEK